MIHYKIVKRRNPKTKKVSFHAASISPRAVSLSQLTDRISDRCTATSADVKAVLDALEKEMIEVFKAGDSLRLGDVGTFRPSIRSAGVEQEDKVTAQLIKSVHIVYTPSLRIKSYLDPRNGLVQFQKSDFVPAKAKKKADKPAESSAESH